MNSGLEVPGWGKFGVGSFAASDDDEEVVVALEGHHGSGLVVWPVTNHDIRRREKGGGFVEV